MSEDKILEEAIDRFNLAQDAESENRDLALDDVRFAHGEQWPDSVREQREKDARPVLVINRVPAFVRQVVNDIRQIRPSIKVRGIDSQTDPEKAKDLNGIIRAIEQASNADAAYDWAAEHAVTMGFGYWRIDTRYDDEDSFQQCIEINRIRNQFSVFLDPSAEQADGSDAKWGFITEYRDKEELKKQYGDIGEWPDPGDSGHYEDWYTEEKARIAEYWCIKETPQTLTLLSDGTAIPEAISDEDADRLRLAGMPFPVDTRESTKKTVHQYLLVANKILEENEWAGKYIPIVRVLGNEAVIDGKVCYKGMVRDMQDPQRQYNYMRSASVERIALTPKAPYVGARGMFADPKWRRANTDNYAYLEYESKPGEPPPRREPPPDVSIGLVTEVQHAADELKAVTGIYDPALGNQANEVAGVAINARKVESDISNFHFVDNLSRAIRYTGRILVDLIPKIYTDQRVMTILGADGSEEQIQMNSEYVDQKGKRRSTVFAGKYDVAVDVGPSFTTQRQEAVESMLEIAKAFPRSIEVMGDLIAKNMDWPEADEIAKRLKLLLPLKVLEQDNPQVAALVNQFKQKEQMGKTIISQLEEQVKALSMELQNREKDYQIKLGQLMEKKRENTLDHVEGMTKLEIEAGKDLGNAGRYV